MKAFISYSHKDEKHKNDFEEHLSALKREGLITTWSDRDIDAGNDWEDEISENLENAEIIFFLISSSFIASDYCVDKEVKKAISNHNDGRALLIPILVRPCQFDKTELSKIQALPHNLTPISSWSDKDEAWLQVVDSIGDVIKKRKKVKAEVKITQKNQVEVKREFVEWLDDTEVILTHRRVDKVKRSHVYVAPDMEIISEKKPNKVEIISTSKLLDGDGLYLIYGDEQQGKTTLLKNTYVELLKKKYLPLYVSSKRINKSNIKQSFGKEISTQYSNLNEEIYFNKDNKVLLLDDLSDILLNDRYKKEFLKNISIYFKYVIITANKSFAYIAPEIEELSEYKTFSLREFGHEKRAEIVEKWVALGIEENIDEQELYKQCDEVKNRLDVIVKRSIVPSKPIYILMLLQMFEANTQQNLELTSYGHCYQELIYQSLRNASISPADTGKYLNVLTELSWAIYINNDGLNAYGLTEFFKKYSKNYLGVKEESVLPKLYENSILITDGIKTNFKYPYLFYFFTAKKIADYYQKDDEIKKELQKLLQGLHREDYANILVFVTHHTKDNWILDEIEKTLNSLFFDQSKSTLTVDELKFMDEFLESIPELVMEQREIRQERLKHNKKLDEIEHEDDKNEGVEENSEALDILANINKTFKGMDIAGQIIRNRHASLTRDSLYTLANEGTSTGLRFLNYFISISNIAKSEVVKYIEHKLREHPDFTDRKIGNYAKNIFLHMTYGVIYALIRKIASSIGSKEAAEIYQQLEESDPTPAIILLNQAIKLQFNKVLNTNEVDKTHEKLKSNPVCVRILKEMVIQHTYMFPVGYKEKQKLGQILSISIEGQNLMDLKKIGKG